MRSDRVLLVVPFAASVYLLCCEPFDTGPQDAPGVDAGEASTDAGGVDTTVDATDSGRLCPALRGPKAVPVGDGCIDATEVTVGQFREFVTSIAGGLAEAGGAPCSPQRPQAPVNSGSENLPMTSVTFCEARAFCLWAGKQLCGKVTGGPLARGEHDGPTSAWYAACAGDSGTEMPPPLSDGCQLDASAPRPAGAGCEGSVTGVFDMVGNVWEWVDVPYEDDVGNEGSLFMGGAYPNAPSTRCSTTSGQVVDFRAKDVGFRCCSRPP